MRAEVERALLGRMGLNLPVYEGSLEVPCNPARTDVEGV